MTQKFLYLSLLCNVILLGALAVHWPQISLRYNAGSVPPLSCYQLSSAYIASHADLFALSGQIAAGKSNEAEMTAEQAKAFRQSVFVQDTAAQIEELCNQEIKDFTDEAAVTEEKSATEAE